MAASITLFEVGFFGKLTCLELSTFLTYLWVEQPAHNLKFKGLNPADTGTGGRQWLKTKITFVKDFMG